MKNIIVTGANSMDSKELTHILLARGHRVILTYRRNTSQDLEVIRNLFSKELAASGELQFELCDISDQSSVIACIKNCLIKYGEIHQLYMMAAIANVGTSFFQKEQSIITNGQSYYYFLEAIKNHSRNTRVYGALTSELAGNVPEGSFFTEKTCWNPKSPYSYGKALGGHWIKHYRESTDCNLYCCFGILFNHSSVYRSKDYFIRKMTNSFARITLGKQEFVNFGFLDFWRDEGYSSFYAEQMINLLDNPNGPADYVIATGKTHHAEEFLDICGSYFNIDWTKVVKIDNEMKRPNEVVRLIGSPEKAIKDFNYNPNRMPFKDHIELMSKYDYDLESNGKAERPNVFDLYK